MVAHGSPAYAFNQAAHQGGKTLRFDLCSVDVNMQKRHRHFNYDYKKDKLEKATPRLLLGAYDQRVTCGTRLALHPVGPLEPLLATVKRRKLVWFGHVTRLDNLPETILQGT